MPLYRASLQTLGAIVLLAMALACHGKGGNNGGATSTITGTVMYQRVPLVKDASGVPTGLADATVAANLVSLPAQGVSIRIYQQVAQIAPDGSTTYEWTLAGSATTNYLGIYSTTVPTGWPTMVEVLSTFNGGVLPGGTAQAINLIAEPQGISSSTPAPDRVQYAMRAAADGSVPANNNAPATVLTANSIVNFIVGLNDKWWVYNPSINSSTRVAAFAGQAVPETSLTGLATGTGSRILGIGDTIASFVNIYGAATPGATLDLHYFPGVDSGGSYIVYDRSLNPLSLASSTYFGTLRGGPTNDDAWDVGVILPMLARNVLYGGNLTRTFSVPLNPLYPISTPLADLSPDMARIEGLAQAMAANVLQSPYLADTQGTGLAAPVVDIRNISGLSTAQLNPYSAPAIQAFAWQIILQANGLPSPGVATDWANINPLAAARFFLAPGGLTGIAISGTPIDIEPLNIYSQITRLKEPKSTIEPFDLALVFTDAVLTNLGSPFGITWPRPTTGPYASFVADWGTDPTGMLPPVALSMAKSTQVNLSYPSATLAYPNVSEGEVFYAGFNLSADKACALTATISPALGAGAQLNVDLPMIPRTFTFSGSGGTTGALVLPVNNIVPYYHPVRIRMLSPSVLQPDVTVTLALTPSN